jgi:RND family efflux transporter MFP subunit
MLKKIIYIVVALALIVFTVLRLKTNKEHTVERVYQYDKEKPISIQSVTVKLENMDIKQSFTGTFEPWKETKISADVQGKVNAVLVDLGSRVRKGETLIRLDHALLKLQLESVEVQIEGLESDVSRYSILAKADAIQGVQLEKAALGLKSAKVQRALLQEQINKTSIKSPFDGIVTGKLTEEGAFAAPGMPLLQITDLSKLRFTVNVAESDLRMFDADQTRKVSADVYPDILLQGKVIMTGSQANPGSSYPVQLAVDNTPDQKIKSGMFGKVLMETAASTEQIIIPASAIVGATVQPQVYIIKNGKAHLQNIVVGERFENKAIVADGLQNGDVLVTGGFINLFDGANVILK